MPRDGYGKNPTAPRLRATDKNHLPRVPMRSVPSRMSLRRAAELNSPSVRRTSLSVVPFDGLGSPSFGKLLSAARLRRAADWIIPVAGLARVQCPHPMAIRSLATPATDGIYVTAVRVKAPFDLPRRKRQGR